jgi:hypothetical protein
MTSVGLVVVRAMIILVPLTAVFALDAILVPLDTFLQSDPAYDHPVDYMFQMASFIIMSLHN